MKRFISLRHKSTMAEYTLFTGGAAGCDSYWQQKAEQYGLQVQIMTFVGHNLNIRAQNVEVKILTSKKLEEADVFLETANERLRRQFPPNSAYKTNLLRRNYYIIEGAEAVVAVAPVKGVQVDGGTAWGVELGDQAGIPVYVYSLNDRVWYRYHNGKFNAISIPTLPRRFAGIGTRALTQEGKRVIDQVFEWNFDRGNQDKED